MTTRGKRSAKSVTIKAPLGDDRKLLKGLAKESLLQVLEAEMTEALGTRAGEHMAERLGYRGGCYGRGPVTRIGKLELRVPRDRGQTTDALQAVAPTDWPVSAKKRG